MVYGTAAIPQEVRSPGVIPQGEPGKDGKDGKSAYQIALDNGFEGTEQEWLDSLKGEKGKPGEDGAPATINGVNALTLKAQDGIKATQEGDALTLSGKEILDNTGAKTVTGESISVTDSVKYPLLGLTIYGKSTQDGVPDPTNPVDIVSVGDDGEVAVTACGKNLLYAKEQTVTNNGVTFTVNPDKTITANGTASDTSWGLYTVGTVALKAGVAYRLSGCPIEGLANKKYRIVALVDGVAVGADNGEGATFTLDVNAAVVIRIDVVSGYTANNLLFKPMICFASIADDTYEPYTGSTASITSALPLGSINETRDEFIYKDGGTNKLVKNTGDLTISSSNTIVAVNPYEASTVQQYNVTVPALNCASMAKSMCNILPRNEGVISGGVLGHLIYRNTIIILTLPKSLLAEYGYIFSDSSTYVPAIKAYVADNPIQIKYELATPEEIELTAAEMAQIKQLYGYNGVTNIFNDEGAEMAVKYCTSPLASECWLPLFEDIKSEMAEVKAAILSAGANI